MPQILLIILFFVAYLYKHYISKNAFQLQTTKSNKQNGGLLFFLLYNLHRGIIKM